MLTILVGVDFSHLRGRIANPKLIIIVAPSGLLAGVLRPALQIGDIHGAVGQVSPFL
jgi:hypothetical protein